MKQYENPEMEIFLFGYDSVLTTSLTTDADWDTGEEGGENDGF